MNRSSALFLSLLLICQIMAGIQNADQQVPERKGDFDIHADFETSGRNGTSSGNNSTSDAHCLVLNNLTLNQTYYVSIYLVNICSDGINYPGINASSDNSGVDGLDEMWWYLIPGSNMNSSNISDYPYYHMSYQLSLNQSIPNGTAITLYFEATVLHCGPNNSWSNDCPNSNNSNLSYQFTYPLGYNSTNNNGNNTAGNNTGGNETSGNNTTGNNTGDDTNNSIYIPDYYLLISDFWSDGFDFFGVANVMNGTWVPVNVIISKNDTNYPLNFDHMLALTFHTDGHTEEEHTIYLGHFEDQFSYDVSGEVYVTHETTFVEISFDVLTCLNETCDLTVPVEERFHPVDPQYHKSFNTTDFPTVVELSDEIFDLETMTEEEQQNGKEIPRFTFEIEEVDFDGEMYYKIVVTSCQMDLATHHILVNIIWSKDNMGTKEVLYETWNLADPDRVYGFYPANSNSSVTFLDQLDYFPDPSTNGVSVVSTFGAGDIIFIKSGFENGIINDAITITYDMYPAEDDGITLGAVLRSWDFGSQEGSVVNDTSQDNPDSDNDSSGLPSTGVFGTLVAIGVSVVAATSRRKNE